MWEAYPLHVLAVNVSEAIQVPDRSSGAILSDDARTSGAVVGDAVASRGLRPWGSASCLARGQLLASVTLPNWRVPLIVNVRLTIYWPDEPQCSGRTRDSRCMWLSVMCRIRTRLCARAIPTRPSHEQSTSVLVQCSRLRCVRGIRLVVGGVARFVTTLRSSLQSRLNHPVVVLRRDMLIATNTTDDAG
jgi:hypothetical protein